MTADIVHQPIYTGLTWKSFKRLFTTKDEFITIPHFHKFLGFTTLIHFVYRFGLYFIYGDMQFSLDNAFDVISLVWHLALSASSLIFHVLQFKKTKEPYLIFEELRLHNILFASRSVFVIFMSLIYMKGLYFSSAKNMLTYKAIGFLMFHLLVDYVTKVHGTPDVTTIRGYTKINNKRPWIYMFTTRFYSFTQLVGLNVMLTRTTDLIHCAYFTIFAVQIATFLGTLRLKGIINAGVANFVYGSSIVMINVASYWDISRGFYWNYFMKEMGFVLIITILRFRFNVNKYILWSVYGFISFNYLL